MSTFRCVWLSLFVLPMMALDAEQPAWTGWLGPNRDGWVQHFQPPAQWPEELSRRWQIDTGMGYSSPIVHEGIVYQHARIGEDEVVTAVEIASGKVRWQQKQAVPFRVRGGGEFHGKGPKSSPCLADGRLFTVSIDGTITAWNVSDGQQLWQRSYQAEFGQGHPHWGASASPVVDDNRLIMHVGHEKTGTLVALNVETGEEVWRQGSRGAEYSSPVLTTLAGVRQVLDWNHDTLAGVNSETGELLWEFPFAHVSHNQNMPTPSVHDGCVLIGGENRGMYRLRPQRVDGQWKVEEVWFQEKIALDMSSAVVNGAYLYGMSHYDSGRLFCLEIATGEIVWTGKPRVGRNVMFLSTKDYVLALLDSGRIQVLRAAARDTRIVREYTVSEQQAWAPPVLLEKEILVKDKQRLTLWSIGS